jgi:hypothetical protein
MSSTHCKAQDITRTELATIETPPPQGPYHTPIPHDQFVDALLQRIDDYGFEVAKESYSVSRSKEIDGKRYNNTLLTGTMDLKTDNEEMCMSIAFITSNAMKTKAHIMSGRSVFVCDNLMISGDVIVMKKKHTINLDLAAELGRGFEKLLHNQEDIDTYISNLKGHRMKDNAAKLFIYEAIAKRQLPQRFFNPVHNLYFGPLGRQLPDIAEHRGTAWGLYNSMTRAVKPLPLTQKVVVTRAIDVPFRTILN